MNIFRLILNFFGSLGVSNGHSPKKITLAQKKSQTATNIKLGNTD